MNKNLRSQLHRLQARVAAYPDALVAFSGGTDSSVVLRLCRDFLGKRTQAVLVKTPLISNDSVSAAKATARRMGIPLTVLSCNVLRHPQVRANQPQRCYACKKMMISKLREYARQAGLTTIVNGANADDERALRPGTRALQEAGVRSPLAEIGLTKEDVRLIARQLRLPNWNVASDSCLATRIPFHTRLFPSLLAKLAEAERLLKKKGLTAVRCRLHRDILRVEVSRQERQKALRVLTAGIGRTLKHLGVRYVCLDVEGFRSGSMDDAHF